MPSLRELQLGFSRAVFGGEAGFGQGCIETDALSGERRLQIYRNNTYASLSDALRSTYPVVHRLVGDGFFRYAAHRYITRYPSTSGNLHDFGAQFPEFLAGFEPAAALTYLPDVARLEWACEQVSHAAEAPLLDPLALAGVSEEHYGELRFTLNPAGRLLASGYPVLRIWQVNQEDYAGDQTVDLEEGGVRLLILRNAELEVEIQALQGGEFAFLQTLAEGRPFAEACECALETQPDFDLPAGFRRHIVQGTLVDFRLENG